MWDWDSLCHQHQLWGLVRRLKSVSVKRLLTKPSLTDVKGDAALSMIALISTLSGVVRGQRAVDSKITGSTGTGLQVLETSN